MHSLEAKQYTDVHQFSLEKERIFEREWIPFAHISELPTQTHALERTLLGHSIIIIRDASSFRAFRNICPHRAGPLLWSNECTPIKALRCRYHGWRYDLKGTRTNSPDFGATIEGHNLQSIAIQVWKGLLFVTLNPSPPSFSLRALLDTHAPDLSSFYIHSTATHHLRCNWKTYVENYLEGYHIPYMHPSLKASIQQSQYKVHIHDQLITHEVPTDPKSSVSGFWAYLWPNTAINVYGSGMSIERILPIDTDNTQIHYLYLFQPNSSEKEITSTIEMSREVTEEDIKICNAVAHNLRTGMYSKGPLSPKHEHGIWHVHNLIKKALS